MCCEIDLRFVKCVGINVGDNLSGIFCFQYRTYDALRKEHDAQIVQIATEAGLRILPDQWSSLLYGDLDHKSHMQSIIDKVQ